MRPCDRGSGGAVDAQRQDVVATRAVGPAAADCTVDSVAQTKKAMRRIFNINQIRLARFVEADGGGGPARRGQARDRPQEDRKSTRLNSSHQCASRMPSS